MRSFVTYVLNIFPCFLISTICCDIKASIQFSHFLSFHCLSVKLCNECNRQPSTGSPAERRTPLYFLTSSRSFSVSFLGPVHLLLQSLRLNESLKQSMGERLLKSVDILLSSSLRTRAVSRAFLNQCKGAWKRGRSYVYLLICWLVNHLVCYVITTRENCNPSL